MAILWRIRNSELRATAQVGQCSVAQLDAPGVVLCLARLITLTRSKSPRNIRLAFPGRPHGGR